MQRWADYLYPPLPTAPRAGAASTADEALEDLADGHGDDWGRRACRRCAGAALVLPSPAVECHSPALPWR